LPGLFARNEREIFAFFCEIGQPGFICREKKARFFVEMPSALLVDTD
jgi:hypothetical protein